MENPLLNLSDIQLVSNIKENKNANENLEEIVRRHTGIFRSILSKFLKKNGRWEETYLQDILEEKNYHIYQACLKYDPNRGSKFSTFLANHTKWACLTAITEHTKPSIFENTFDDIQEVPDSKLDGKEELKKEMLGFFRTEINFIKDSRVKSIFHLRYFEENKIKPWKEIGAKMSLSGQACINIHNKALKEISKKIKNKHENYCFSSN